MKEVTILNSKAKVVWVPKGYFGGTIFDGPMSGMAGNKIVIKGYKNSTAQKLTNHMQDAINAYEKYYMGDYMRYRIVVFTPVRR